MGDREYSRKFALPLVFFERISKLFREAPDDAPPRAMVWGLVRTLWACRVKYVITPSVLRYVSQRIDTSRASGVAASESEDDRKAAEEAAARLGAKDFQPEGYGEYFIRWASKLTPFQMCVYLADGDPVRANEFYSKVDRDDVLDAFEVKTSWEGEAVRYRVEAALYGFGGGYKKKGGSSGGSSSSSSDGSETVYDMTTPEGQAAGLAALKRKGY